MSQIKIENISNQPWVLYEVTTGHGSHLLLYFKHEQSFLHHETGLPYCHGGGLHVKGYSESQKDQVELWGLGFEPEVGGRVAVAVLGKREDDSPILAEELITKIISRTVIGASID